MARTISPTDLDQRLAASLARIELTPEYRWRMVKRRRPKLDLSPLGMADKRLPIAMKELPSLMEDRMKLMRLADFRPWMYPGLRPAVRKTDDPGWLEWCIFPDARLVAEYAEAHRPELAKVTREVAEQIRKRAGFWIRYRLGTAKGLSTDDVARCKAFISDALRGQGSGRVTQGRDSAEREREWVNAMLKIKSPWERSPTGGSVDSVSTSSTNASAHAPGGQSDWPPRRYPEVERLLKHMNPVLVAGGRLLEEWKRCETYCTKPRPSLASALATWTRLPERVTTDALLAHRHSQSLKRDRSKDDHRHVHNRLDVLALRVRVLRRAIDGAYANVDAVWRRMDDRKRPQRLWWTSRLKRTLRKIGGLIPRDLGSDLPVGLGSGVDQELEKLLEIVRAAFETLKDTSEVPQPTSDQGAPKQGRVVGTHQEQPADLVASADASARHIDAVRRFRALYDEQLQLRQQTHGAVEVVREFLNRARLATFSMDAGVLAVATQSERRAMSLYLLAGFANIHPELGVADVHRLPGCPTPSEKERDDRGMVLWESAPQWTLQAYSCVESWARLLSHLVTNPTAALMEVLGSLQTVGLSLGGLRELMIEREHRRSGRRSVGNATSQERARHPKEATRTGARFEKVKSIRGAATDDSITLTPEHQLKGLLVALRDGIELCGVAKRAVRAGGAARLVAVDRSNSAKSANELWSAIDNFERAMGELVIWLPDPRIVVEDQVRVVSGLLEFSQNAINELMAADAVSEPVSGANPVRSVEKTKLAAREDATRQQAQLMASPSGADDDRSMDHYRDAAWIRNATQDGLESDMLRKAMGRGTLREMKKVGKRWMFSVLELIRVYPQYGSQLRDARIEGVDFRKSRKRESGKRSNSA